jgi:hypothetical protein
MNRILTLAIILALGASGANAAACKDPKTGKFIKCPVAAAAPMAATAGGPKCVKGKRCGNACIAVTKICHKP